jgi:hypothetical protein
MCVLFINLQFYLLFFLFLTAEDTSKECVEYGPYEEEDPSASEAFEVAWSCTDSKEALQVFRGVDNVFKTLASLLLGD